MQGLMTLQPTYQIAGKKSEYKTKKEFVEAIREENDQDVLIEDVKACCMRYFPKGTEDSQGEWGTGVGVYQVVDELTKGAFEVWIV